MSAYIQWDGGQLLFDLTVNEQHEGTVEITKFPVEEGVDVNDHVRKTPDAVTIDFFISNAPIFSLGRGGSDKTIPLDVKKYQAPFNFTPGAVFGAVEGAISSAVNSLLGNDAKPIAAQVLAFDSDFDSVADALDTLRQLQGDETTAATLVDVTTSKRTYENMIVEHFEMTRGADEGTGASVRIRFAQLRKVATKIVNAPVPTEARGQKAKSTGAKGGKDAKDPEKKKSVAASILDGIVGGNGFLK